MDELLFNLNDLQLTQKEFLIRLLVAIGIGFLIGLEREHSAMTEKEDSFAGIRTFIIIVLSGFIGALMHFLISPWIFGSIIAAVILFIGISYRSTAARGDIGGTTEFTALLAFFLGSLSLMGYIQVSLLLSVLILMVLSAKIRLHRIIGKISREELYAIIRFVVSAIVILPFLPDANYGPYQVVNPREIGWVVLLTSGIGFTGYLLMKFLGQRKGILLTGIIGGLVSSTMSTWIFARKSKEAPALTAYFASAILIASSVMGLRVMLWVTLFGPSLAKGLYLPLALVVLTALVFGFYLFAKQKSTAAAGDELPAGKPLEIQSALLFGLIYLIITLVMRYAGEQAGNGGILLTSAIAGLTDIDAIVISVSKLSLSIISTQTAQYAILIGLISNTLVKLGIGLWAGSRALKRDLLLGYGAIIAAAVLGFFTLNGG